MKKTALSVLVVLTIFVNYFYIHKNTTPHILRASAAEYTDYFRAISTCVGQASISSFPQDKAPANYSGLKILDEGKKVEIALKTPVDFTYVSPANSGFTSLIYNNTTNGVTTRLEIINSGDYHARIENKDGGDVSDEDIAKLGDYGGFISYLKSYNTTGASGGYGSGTVVSPADIPLALDRCQVFDPGKPVIGTITQTGGNTSKPKISIAESQADSSNGKSWSRPAGDYVLSNVIYPDTGVTVGKNIFYFKYSGSDEKMKNIAVKFFSDSTALAVNFGDINNPNDDSDAGGFLPVASYTSVQFDKQSIYLYLYNFVYNMNKGDGTCGDAVGPGLKNSSGQNTNYSNWSPTTNPNESCLNTTDKGWLHEWGITMNASKFTDSSTPPPTDSTGTATGSDRCSGFSLYKGFASAILGAVCGLAIFLSDIAQSIMCFAQNKLADSLGMLDVNFKSSTCTKSTTPIPNNFK